MEDLIEAASPPPSDPYELEHLARKYGMLGRLAKTRGSDDRDARQPADASRAPLLTGTHR
jgi:hypothetical protein